MDLGATQGPARPRGPRLVAVPIRNACVSSTRRRRFAHRVATFRASLDRARTPAHATGLPERRKLPSASFQGSDSDVHDVRGPPTPSISDADGDQHVVATSLSRPPRIQARRFRPRPREAPSQGSSSAFVASWPRTDA